MNAPLLVTVDLEEKMLLITMSALRLLVFIYQQRFGPAITQHYLHIRSSGRICHSRDSALWPSFDKEAPT